VNADDTNGERPSRVRVVNAGITEGGVRRGLWRLALPMVLTGALHDLFTVADLWFISRLGDVPVAALTVCGTILSIIIMLIMGVGTGTIALVAHFVGKREYERADDTAFQTMVLGTAVAATMAVLGLFGSRWLVTLFGVEAQVAQSAAGYLRISLTFSIFLCLSVGMSQALHGAGDVMTPFRLLLVTNVLNVILDPLLIFGIGPFPEMGIEGSAVATVVSRGLLTLLLCWHLASGPSALHLSRRSCRLDFPIIRRILAIGVFSSAQVFTMQLSMLILMRLVATFGTATVAAYGIANRLRFMVAGPGFGLSAVGAVMVGQNMGAGRADRAERSVWETVTHYQAFAIPAAIVYVVMAPRLIGVFSRNPEVIGIGATYLRYLGVAFPFVACSIVLGRSMNGAGDTLAPALMTAVGQLGLRLPLAFVLGLLTPMGATGIWLGICGADAAQSVLFVFYFRSGRWKQKYYRHRVRLEQQVAQVNGGGAPPPNE